MPRCLLCRLTYEDSGYGGYDHYGASGYRNDYGYGYRPDEDRYHRQYGGDYCNYYRCERFH